MTTRPAGTTPSSSFLLEEGSPEDARLLALILAASAARRELDRRMAGVQAGLAALAKEREASRARLAALDADQRTLTVRLAQVRLAVEQAHQDLARRAVAAYTGEPTGGFSR